MSQLEQVMQALVEFMRANQQWAIPIVFLVAFGECVALLSWLVPATVFFTAFAAVAGASGLNLIPLAFAASLGAGCGFWISYWAGGVLGPRVGEYWPLNKNPELLERGHAFFEKWGVLGILRPFLRPGARRDRHRRRHRRDAVPAVPARQLDRLLRLGLWAALRRRPHRRIPGALTPEASNRLNAAFMAGSAPEVRIEAVTTGRRQATVRACRDTLDRP